MIIIPSNKNCGICGTLLEQFKIANESVSKINIHCQVCNQEKEYETICKRLYANSKLAIDPYFGLPLWLQITLESNIFWALNYSHLGYLKQYVSAKLREENSISQYSITQKLPNFIKLAKNRSKILKTIEKLEKPDFISL